MAEALERAGVPNRLIVVDGARHGFEAMVREPVERDLLPEILAFLERIWNVSLGGAKTGRLNGQRALVASVKDNP